MARPDGPAMSADEAAVRTGLAVLARIDLTMNAVRGDLLQQLERLSGSRPGHAVAATRAVAGARSDGKGKKKGRRTHTG